MVVKRGECECIVEDGIQGRWMLRYCRELWSGEVDVKVLQTMVVKRGGFEGIVEDGGQEMSMKVLQRMVVKRGGCEGDGGQESWM